MPSTGRYTGTPNLCGDFAVGVCSANFHSAVCAVRGAWEAAVQSSIRADKMESRSEAEAVNHRGGLDHTVQPH